MPSVTGDGGWCGAGTDCGTHENARREGGGWVEEGGREGSQYVSQGVRPESGDHQLKRSQLPGPEPANIAPRLWPRALPLASQKYLTANIAG